MITGIILLLQYIFIFTFMTFLEFGCDLTEIESNETKATRQIFKWNTLTGFWHMNVYLDFYFEKQYFFNKIVLTYCEMIEKKRLKFEAEGGEFAKFLRSQEQFIQTVRGQNNFR